MSIKPLHDRVLLRRVNEEGRSAGGIIIPDTAKEKPMKAQVIAVGPGERLKDGERRHMSVKPGDTVLIGKYAGTEVKYGGEEHILLREDEIFAIVE
jgi:chaperonin GroES